MKIQPHKEIALMKSERASAPEITKRKNRLKKKKEAVAPGSITIEAAFGIPLFLFAVLCLIWLIELQSIRFSIVNAAQNAAKSAAEDTAVIPVLNVWKMRSDIADLIGKERLDRSIVKGGKDGISCVGSYVSPETGEMNIKVTYEIYLPVPVIGHPSAEVEQSFKLSAWTGYMNGGKGSDGADIVYVTDNGEVYHEDYRCSHLRLSIRAVGFDEIKQLRNEGGGIYHACEKCVYGLPVGSVYITDTGDRYHNSVNCSGLKRTIHAVKLTEIKGLGGCSRCAQ